mmetsp:Transcript_43314/g.72131  ORF Transcript_43314/g.72131 Transcript_43314/m.72131 type:complete len:374 (+) Transcript_43314:94-1215(+)
MKKRRMVEDPALPVYGDPGQQPLYGENSQQISPARDETSQDPRIQDAIAVTHAGTVNAIVSVHDRRPNGFTGDKSDLLRNVKEILKEQRAQSTKGLTPSQIASKLVTKGTAYSSKQPDKLARQINESFRLLRKKGTLETVHFICKSEDPADEKGTYIWTGAVIGGPDQGMEDWNEYSKKDWNDPANNISDGSEDEDPGSGSRPLSIDEFLERLAYKRQKLQEIHTHQSNITEQLAILATKTDVLVKKQRNLLREENEISIGISRIEQRFRAYHATAHTVTELQTQQNELQPEHSIDETAYQHLQGEGPQGQLIDGQSELLGAVGESLIELPSNGLISSHSYNGPVSHVTSYNGPIAQQTYVSVLPISGVPHYS